MARDGSAQSGRGSPPVAVRPVVWQLGRRLSPRFMVPAMLALAMAATFAPRMADAGGQPPVFPGQASIYFNPLAANLFIAGDELVLEETVAGVPYDPGLGSFQLDVVFNPTLLAITIEEGPFLASTGNTTNCGITAVTETNFLYNCSATGTNQGPYGSGVLTRDLAHNGMTPENAGIIR